jgi:hypothetical protein
VHRVVENDANRQCREGPPPRAETQGQEGS